MSKVYMTDLRTRHGESLLCKLTALLQAAGFETLDWEGKFAAIKVHFGEPGNLAFVNPAYARTVAEYIKRLGGIPFLTDCNTLYAGRRKNAIDHLGAAYENGFNPLSTGCHVIIADGLLGNDEVEVPVRGEYVTAAKIGRAVMEADVFVSLTHFKGHDFTGIGGCLKNVGMGCGSRAGKEEMHRHGKPRVREERCIGCGTCLRYCGQGAIWVDGVAHIDPDKCVGCGHCITPCPKVAIRTPFAGADEKIGQKIAEYSLAVLQGRPQFHINMVVDVSPSCDCNDYNDVPIVPDVGMFASFDPVALDQACGDAVNAQKPLPGSSLAEDPDCGKRDHWSVNFPQTDWQAGLAHAEKIGLGSRTYELIRVD